MVGPSTRAREHLATNPPMRRRSRRRDDGVRRLHRNQPAGSGTGRFARPDLNLDGRARLRRWLAPRARHRIADEAEDVLARLALETAVATERVLVRRARV